MWRKILGQGVDPILTRIARRLEWACQNTMCKEMYQRAAIDPCAKFYSGASINTFDNNPQSIVIGAHTHVRGHLQTFSAYSQIDIGRWCYIGGDARIWSQSSISIGNHVLISHLVDIHDTNSHPIGWRERRLDAQIILSGQGHRSLAQTWSAPIVIEDDVWIGFKSTILKGVHVGRGAIIAAGAVVTKDIEPWSVVGGNPARVIRVLKPIEF